MQYPIFDAECYPSSRREKKFRGLTYLDETSRPRLTARLYATEIEAIRAAKAEWAKRVQQVAA